MIKIFGVQRTGTNYLTSLIEENLKVEVFKKEFGWKHGEVPWPTQYLINTDNKRSFTRQQYLKSLVEKKRMLGVFIVKNPYSWIGSIERWANKSWPEPFTTEQYIDLYNSRYKHYLGFWNTTSKFYSYKRFIFVQYESLLRDLEHEIKRIGKFVNIDVGEVHDVVKVALSAKFTEAKRRYYLNPPKDERIEDLVDWETFQYYGYRR